jgi:hypothetical protein
MTCALIASRLVSMTFIPLLGYYLLRPSRKPERSVEERRVRGFTGMYYRVGAFAIAYRWWVLVGSLAFLGLGAYVMMHMKTAFFPEDLQYWSYVDIWLPNDTTLSATNKVAIQADTVIRTVVEEYGRTHPDKHGRPRQLLKSLTTFVGGGGPRFWFSVSPELQQLNYAQLIIEVTDKEDTPRLVDLLQQALSKEVTGGRAWTCASSRLIRWKRHSRCACLDGRISTSARRMIFGPCAGWRGRSGTFSTLFQRSLASGTTGTTRVFWCSSKSILIGPIWPA